MPQDTPQIEIPVLRRDALTRHTRDVLSQLEQARDRVTDPLDAGTRPSAVMTSFELREGFARATPSFGYTLFFETSAANRRLSQLAEEIRPLAGYALATCLDDQLLLNAGLHHLSGLSGPGARRLKMDAYCTSGSVLLSVDGIHSPQTDGIPEVETIRRDLSASYTLLLLGEPSAHEAMETSRSMHVLIDSLIRNDIEQIQASNIDEETDAALDNLGWRLRFTG